jgi:hypothetical protein
LLARNWALRGRSNLQAIPFGKDYNGLTSSGKNVQKQSNNSSTHYPLMYLLWWLLLKQVSESLQHPSSSKVASWVTKWKTPPPFYIPWPCLWCWSCSAMALKLQCHGAVPDLWPLVAPRWRWTCSALTLRLTRGLWWQILPQRPGAALIFELSWQAKASAPWSWANLCPAFVPRPRFHHAPCLDGLGYTQSWAKLNWKLFSLKRTELEFWKVNLVKAYGVWFFKKLT